jgi:hypothetical protein
MLEAMGAGVPVVTHRHIASRLLGGFDLMPTDGFSWRYPNELLNYVENLDSTKLNTLSALFRAHYLQYYHPSIATPYFNNKTNTCVMQPENIGFEPSEEDMGFWLVQQNQLRYELKQKLTRLAKKFKRYLKP